MLVRWNSTLPRWIDSFLAISSFNNDPTSGGHLREKFLATQQAIAYAD